MKGYKKIVTRIFTTLIVLYGIVLLFVYFYQEKLLFHPTVLPQDYLTASLPLQIEEKFIPVDKDVNLHGLLFKTNQPKGLVFYLHGNGGNAYDWGATTAAQFNDLNYDIFILDYRGYGKSGGFIKNEEQLFNDVEKAYKKVAKLYTGKNIVIAGYSIGTGLATHLASGKKIKALILEAPYYSLAKLSDEKIPLIPDFVKKYPINTYKWIGNVNFPIYIFHGTNDELIPFNNSEILKAKSKFVQLTPLPGVGHNGINESYIFADKLKDILN